MSDRRRLFARICPFFVVVLFASTAAAQVKPRIVIAVDTSSSMLSDLNGTGTDTITDGDGVGRKPVAGDAPQRILDGVYYGCGNGGSRPATGAGVDRDGDCFPNDSRIWIAKDAIRKMVLAFGDVEWSLARFRQTQSLNAVPSTGFSVDIDNGSCSTGGEGECLNSFGAINYAGPCCNSACSPRAAGAGEVLVGFPGITGEAFATKDNRPAILRWMDFVETNFKASSDASRAARDVCDHASTSPVYDCELRVPPISGTVTAYTPLGGLIRDAGSYAAALRTQERNAGLDCRNYAIILLTDGAETCDTNPDSEATTLRNVNGIRTYVVGVSVTAADQPALTSLATAGGTTAYFANSPAALSAALGQVVADSLKSEVCDGIDNDCDGETDEDLPAALPGSAPQPQSLFCDGEANRTATQNMQVQERDEPQYDNIALATEIPPPNKVVCGRVADTCENAGVDDDCDGATDEDGALTTCGTCPGAPELCNGRDDDCDGVFDEAPAGSGQAFGACPTTCTGDVPCGSGIGECTQGVYRCVGGVLGTTCTGGTPPQTEVCDGKDNNCNGIIDDPATLARFCTTPYGDEGICQRGMQFCADTSIGEIAGANGYRVDANGAPVCVGQVLPEDRELCDVLDHDCDGDPFTCTQDTCTVGPEPAFVGNVCGLGLGVCVGTLECDEDGNPNGGPPVLVCNAPSPTTERCNNIDDDCNGSIDEGAIAGNDLGGMSGGADGAFCGTEMRTAGVCNPGAFDCINGHWQCRGEAGPRLEVCNGEDDDCDGATDEAAAVAANDPRIGEQCGTTTGECEPGTSVCSGGSVVCTPVRGPVAEDCNGKDDDCDNLIDEKLPDTLPPLGERDRVPCGVATGLCEQGELACVAVASAPDGFDYQCVGGVGPAPELCDGEDNDCDSSTDECTGAPGTPAYVACDTDPLGAMGPAPTNQGLGAGGGDVCGTNVAPCMPGKTKCVADINASNGNPNEPGFVCVGSRDGMLEICNATDDDCDTKIDEDVDEESDPRLGVRCGANVVGPCRVDRDGDGPDDIEDDACGQCRFGQTACVSGAVDCIGEQGPGQYERCNGTDDDCDAEIDECVDPASVPDTCMANEVDPSTPVGTTCGEGACMSGVNRCIDGALECQGVQQGGTEICNNVDDDCDTLIDEGFAKGASCGESEGECQPGTLICDPNGGGGVTCSGDVPPADKEECNSLDDDCDGKIDEGVDLGGPCGTDEGLCAMGTEACVNGRFVCQGEGRPMPETCDCEDNDCDGKIDETGDSPLCPGEAACVMCQCALPCAPAEEFSLQCPQGKAAVEIDDECFCVGAQCKQSECQEMTLTAPGTDTVLCAPDEDTVSACTCKNNACTFRCQGVTCDEALVCDPTDGRCKQRSCLLPQFRCPDDQRCTVDDGVWQCVEDACADKDCAGDEACRDGVCVKSCAKVDCSADFSCSDGTCAPNRCYQVQCEPGQICDPDSGDCVQAGACVRNGCPDGQICNPVGGECQEDPCLRTRCAYGEQCNSETSQCELRCFGGLLYCGDDDCVNPSTSRAHCGAKDDCRGDNAGETCDDGLVCSRGVCSDSCGDGLVNCGGECIDPRTDMRHCGAEGSCAGDEQGEQCRTGSFCKAGRCESIDPTPPPRRPDGTRVIASGGGGCTCSALGAQAAPTAPASRRGLFASLLFALGAAWLLRRRRALRRLSGVPASIGLALFASSLTTLSAGCKVDTFCLDCAAPSDTPPVAGDGSGQSGRQGGGGSGGTTGMSNRPDAMVAPDGGDAMTPRSDAGCAARELCNGVDDDCDDKVDEDADPAEVNIDIDTNPSHCGGCGQVCELDHAFNACSDGACRIDRTQGAGGCDIGYVDLDGLDENGCEYGCSINATNDSDCDSTDNDCDGKTDEDVDLQSDAEHCGTCEVRCTFAHAANGGVCVSGECVLDTAHCDDNFADTDGNEANGCEYRCPVWPTQPETCNGTDDDCDHQTDEEDAVDENDDRIGVTCGDDRGECVAGVVKCVSGTPACDGSVGPTAEVCDGLDNDCDDVVDTDHPDIGLPCGEAPPGSQCSKGTLQIPAGGCSGGVVRELVCVGGQGPVAEVCDGLDNDCDGRSDEAVAGVRPGEGQACVNGSGGVEIVSGNPPGECRAGQTRCVSGNLVCRNEVAPEQYDLCDGLDRDCNGQPFTGFTFSGSIATSGPDPRLGRSCGVDTGECAFGVLRCHRDTNSLTCDNQTLPVAETCDGRDNDCDGRIDERAPNGGGADQPLPGEGVACITNPNGSLNTTPPASASRGECSTGTTVCNAGRMGCQGEQGPRPELCDVQDWDCDGNAVNGVATTDARIGDSCGPPTVGVCRSGTTICSAGANPQVVCQGALPSATYVPPAQTNARETACDGLDNDCDGASDEGAAAAYDGAACCDLSGFSCCPGSGGTRQCSNGRVQCVYPGNASFPVPEACGNAPGGNSNGDDDCDGTIDEGFNTQTDVNNCGGCGITCTPTGNPHGVIVCEAGKCKVGACDLGWVDADFDANPNTNSDWRNGCERTCTFQGTDVCDGEDDDCNGTIDDAPVPQEVCQPYNRGVCANVPQLFSMGPRCSSGTPSCNVQAVATAGFIQHYEATETTCDGRDNDCDGRTDEAQPMVGQPCSNGQGACRTTGVYVCGGSCNAPPALVPAPEICDGIDNNCNGTPDDFGSPNATDIDNFEAVDLGAGTGNTLVMAFEASRPDADAEDQGVLANKPCSTNGVLPWTNVTWGEARAACCALNANGQCAGDGTGWRLCDASTWKFACRSSSAACDYGYSNVGIADCDHDASYTMAQNVCLGAEGRGLVTCEEDVDECAGSTGSMTTFEQCRAEWGATDVWDLSGNVQEWTNTQVSTNIYAIRGGSYSDIEIGRTCAFDFEVGTTTFRFPTTGFRCCKYPAAAPLTCTTFTQTTDVSTPTSAPQQGDATSQLTVSGVTNSITTVRLLDVQGSGGGRFGDLQFRLAAPNGGPNALLVNGQCGDDVNWDFDLRDDAANAVGGGTFCSGSSNVGAGGAYRPQVAFSTYGGRSANGTWTLTVTDTTNRGGSNDWVTLQNWALQVCTQAYVIP